MFCGPWVPVNGSNVFQCHLRTQELFSLREHSTSRCGTVCGVCPKMRTDILRASVHTVLSKAVGQQSSELRMTFIVSVWEVVT